MKKLDFLALVFLSLEIGTLIFYGIEIYQIVVGLIIAPLYLVISKILSVVIMLFTKFSLKLLKETVFKYSVYPIYRLCKIILQNLGLNFLVKRFKHFENFITKVNLFKEKKLVQLFEWWRLKSLIRKWFYLISYLPFFILLMLISLFFSKFVRDKIYAIFKGSIYDALIKMGLKKSKKKGPGSSRILR